MTILLTSLLAACASSGGSSIPPPDPVQASFDDYHIGVDDQVQVSVWRNPELGITVPVRPDGKISVPLVGHVLAGGLTPTQVATDIQTKQSDSRRVGKECGRTSTSRWCMDTY